jgi:hypothetical protein
MTAPALEDGWPFRLSAASARSARAAASDRDALSISFIVLASSSGKPSLAHSAAFSAR